MASFHEPKVASTAALLMVARRVNMLRLRHLESSISATRRSSSMTTAFVKCAFRSRRDADFCPAGGDELPTD